MSVPPPTQIFDPLAVLDAPFRMQKLALEEKERAERSRLAESQEPRGEEERNADQKLKFANMMRARSSNIPSISRQETIRATERVSQPSSSASNASYEGFRCVNCFKFTVVDSGLDFSCDSCGAIAPTYKTVSLCGRGNVAREDDETIRGEVQPDSSTFPNVDAPLLRRADLVKDLTKVYRRRTQFGTNKASEAVARSAASEQVLEQASRDPAQFSRATLEMNKAATALMKPWESTLGSSLVRTVCKSVQFKAVAMQNHHSVCNDPDCKFRVADSAKMLAAACVTMYLSGDSFDENTTSLTRRERSHVAEQIIQECAKTCKKARSRTIMLHGLLSDLDKTSTPIPCRIVSASTSPVAVSPSTTHMQNHADAGEIARRAIYGPRPGVLRRSDSDVSSEASSVGSSNTSRSTSSLAHTHVTALSLQTTLVSLRLPFISALCRGTVSKVRWRLWLASPLSTLTTLRTWHAGAQQSQCARELEPDQERRRGKFFGAGLGRCVCHVGSDSQLGKLQTRVRRHDPVFVATETPTPVRRASADRDGGHDGYFVHQAESGRLRRAGQVDREVQTHRRTHLRTRDTISMASTHFQHGRCGNVMATTDSTNGSSVTVVFRKIEPRWRDEHPINLAAAMFTRSEFTHVELAIGESAGQHGEIANVVRIYNDDVGVELCERTGRSPQFSYLQIGCSKKAALRMLAFARQQLGKPFSMVAMVRSVVYPRQSNDESFFCAELVARTLQVGGLFPSNSNPGSQTPETLYRTLRERATMTANPFVLRQIQMKKSLLNKPRGVADVSSGLMPVHPYRPVGEVRPVPAGTTRTNTVRVGDVRAAIDQNESSLYGQKSSIF